MCIAYQDQNHTYYSTGATPTQHISGIVADTEGDVHSIVLLQLATCSTATVPVAGPLFY